MKILVASVKLVLLLERRLASGLKSFPQAGSVISHSPIVENRIFFSISSVSVTLLFTCFPSSNVIC